MHTNILLVCTFFLRTCLQVHNFKLCELEMALAPAFASSTLVVADNTAFFPTGELRAYQKCLLSMINESPNLFSAKLFFTDVPSVGEDANTLLTAFDDLPRVARLARDMTIDKITFSFD